MTSTDRIITMTVPTKSRLKASEHKGSAVFYVYTIDKDGKKKILTPTPCPSLSMAEVFITEMTPTQRRERQPFIRVMYDLKYDFR